MKIKTVELLNALKAVRPALANKAIVESFVRFFFTGKEVITYNGRIMISYPLNTEGLSFSILAAPFYNFVNKTRAKLLTFAIEENKLKINGKGLNAKMAVDEEPEFPEIEIPKISSKKWKALPEDFSEGLKMCLISVGTDPSSEFSNILFMKTGTIVTSDDVRVSTFQTEGTKEAEFLIPGSSAHELVNFETENLSKYLVTENLVFFATSEGAVFCSTRSADEFPDMLQYLSFDGLRYVLPKDIALSIESAMSLNDDQEDIDRRIDVHINEGWIKCKSESDIGYIETNQKLKRGKLEAKFAINPIFLIHILKHATYITIGEGRALFKSGKFYHLVSLHEED